MNFRDLPDIWQVSKVFMDERTTIGAIDLKNEERRTYFSLSVDGAVGGMSSSPSSCFLGFRVSSV
jgi:hypothetical protein